MSTRERQRSEVLGQIKHGKTKVTQAAEILGITERQMYRLLYRYRSDGDKGLIHRLRGQPSAVRSVNTQAFRDNDSYPPCLPLLAGGGSVVVWRVSNYVAK